MSASSLVDDARRHIVATIEAAIALSEHEVTAALACVSRTYRGIQAQVGDFEDLSRAVDCQAQTLRARAEAHERFSQAFAAELRLQAQMTARAEAMAADVSRFASRVTSIGAAAKILTINASIEAANAGAGRSSAFGTIATEMRNLTREIDLANASISETATKLAATLPEIGARAEKLSEELAAYLAKVATADDLGGVASAVAQSLDRTRQNSDAMGQGASEVFQHLQFQDRMAQQLRLLDRRLDDLSVSVANADAPLTDRGAPASDGARHLFEAGEGNPIELF